MSEWIDVKAVKDIGPGECVVVNLEGIAVAVFNLDGQFFAVEDECTHEAFPLSEGEVEGEAIVCALHGARFSIKTGEVLGEPAIEPVATFPVRVQDGRVQVRNKPGG